jgi:glucose-6-phosphate-specific signal transduction histidine kinase
VNRTLSAGRVRSRRRAPFSVRWFASAPATLVMAAAGVVVIASEQTWRTALFGAVIAAAIAATRVRFALHASAVLLVVLAVLACAGVGVGAGNLARPHSRSTGDGSIRAARPAAGRLRSTGASKRHRRARAR